MDELDVLKCRFHDEFEVLCMMDVVTPVLMTPLQMWAVFSSLQLALRHPDHCGPTAMIAREVALALQTRIAPDPGSALFEVAMRGWRE